MDLSTIGVISAKEKQFNKKGIYTIEDLVNFFPRKYNDFTKETGLLPEDQISCLVLKINSVNFYDGKSPIIGASCIDPKTNNKFRISWFNQKFMFALIKGTEGKNVLVAGKANYNKDFDNYSMANPLLYTVDIDGGKKIYPVYSKISGMSDNYLTGKVEKALHAYPGREDVLPEEIKNDNCLLEYCEAIKELHCPTNAEKLTNAQQRLVFEDLLYFASKLEQNNRKMPKGTAFNIRSIKVMNNVIEKLPFKLTKSQDNSIREMIAHMRKGFRLNALLQGDTGAGKSIVAFALMIAMAENGFQSALMAPTQILAMQHYNELSNLLEPLKNLLGTNTPVAFYGGSKMKVKEKRELLEKIKTGEVLMIVGTHSLISKDVEYKNLALAITDEEHKFGCLQRESLSKKAEMGVNVLNMSATPIPRTLAQVIYGDYVQLYNIEKPENRILPKTAICNNQKQVFNLLYREIKAGRQAYIVCPKIDKNEEDIDAASIESLDTLYHKAFDSYGIKIATITGRHKKDEADEIINEFKNGNTDILIATSIIEVGVSVPNATVMVIHDANYFGLSSIHQLRGRIMRNDEGVQPYCILMSKDVENERLKVLEKVTDGLEIAKADLILRNSGELIDGTEQSGKNKYVDEMLLNPATYNYIKTIVPDLLDRGMLDKLLESRKQED